jgi:hypothetical protein
MQPQKEVAGQWEKRHYFMKEQSAKYPILKKPFSWLFLLVLLAAGACDQNELSDLDNDSADANARLAGTWKVIAYEDLANNTRTVKDAANSRGLDVILTFEGDGISGKCTTNQVTGKFSYTGTREISIKEYGGTEIGEPRWGEMFHEAIFKLKEFTINSNTLTFYYNNGQNAVTLEKQ